MSPGGAWIVERRTGTADELHRPWPEGEARANRVVAICEVVGPPTLVLGSSQPDPAVVVDGLETARRSSGGGAVLVAPGAQAWIDVWLPRSDPLWDDDVVRSSAWLGSAWRRGLFAAGVRLADLEVHAGRLERTHWSDLICFAGVGPGEVCWNDKKLVGLAQRRTRAGARFHTMSPVDPVRDPMSTLSQRDAGAGRELDSFLAARTTCLSEVIGAVYARGTTRADRAVDARGTTRADGDRHVEHAPILERITRSVVSAVSDAA